MVVFRGDTYVILCILKYLPRTSHSWTIGFSLYCCINLVPFPSLPHTFLYYCDLIVFFAFVTPRKPSVQFSSVTQLCLTLCDPMNRTQHARRPCPSPTPGIHSDSRPSSRWCHSAISSSAVPFSSCSQSLPASESFPMSQLFAWGGQSTGVSALASFWVIHII